MLVRFIGEELPEDLMEEPTYDLMDDGQDNALIEDNATLWQVETHRFGCCNSFGFLYCMTLVFLVFFWAVRGVRCKLLQIEVVDPTADSSPISESPTGANATASPPVAAGTPGASPTAGSSPTIPTSSTSPTTGSPAGATPTPSPTMETRTAAIEETSGAGNNIDTIVDHKNKNVQTGSISTPRLPHSPGSNPGAGSIDATTPGYGTPTNNNQNWPLEDNDDSNSNSQNANRLLEQGSEERGIFPKYDRKDPNDEDLSIPEDTDDSNSNSQNANRLLEQGSEERGIFPKYDRKDPNDEDLSIPAPPAAAKVEKDVDHPLCKAWQEIEPDVKFLHCNHCNHARPLLSTHPEYAALLVNPADDGRLFVDQESNVVDLRVFPTYKKIRMHMKKCITKRRFDVNPEQHQIKNQNPDYIEDFMPQCFVQKKRKYRRDQTHNKDGSVNHQFYKAKSEEAKKRKVMADALATRTFANTNNS